MNEKRAAYIRMVVAMTKAGIDDLILTKDKSAYFLRGIIDYAENGKHANLDVRWAPTTYSYSKQASVLKHEKNFYLSLNLPMKLVSSISVTCDLFLLEVYINNSHFHQTLASLFSTS